MRRSTALPSRVLTVLALAYSVSGSGQQAPAERAGAGAEVAATLAAAGLAVGEVVAPDGERLGYAAVIVRDLADSAIVKVGVSNPDGSFEVGPVPEGSYFATAEYVGLTPLATPEFTVEGGSLTDLGSLQFSPDAEVLAEAVVTAERSLVEVRADRTVFNVAGTVMASSGDGLSALQRAPGVTIDDGIAIAGRPGVAVYINGKRSPLGASGAMAMLRNLPADRIERIEIIHNPGPRYDAEGAGGIIDVYLRRAEGEGTNGSISLSGSMGRAARGSVTTSLTHRGPRWDSHATLNLSRGKRLYEYDNLRTNEVPGAASFYADERIDGAWDSEVLDLRIGTTVDLGGGHALGGLATLTSTDEGGLTNSSVALGWDGQPADSILRATSDGRAPRLYTVGNLNYRYAGERGFRIGADADFGRYARDEAERQPNRYFAPDGTPLTSLTYLFETPSTITVASGQVDLAQALGAGELEAGVKLTEVNTDQEFSYNLIDDGERVHFGDRSREFDYHERVSAVYASYSTEFGGGEAAARPPATLSVGLRVEHTSSRGTVAALGGEPVRPDVNRDYVNYFPSASLGYPLSPGHQVSLSYGRRVQRPGFGVLTPFVGRLNDLSAQVGDPEVRPELVDAFDLTYRLAKRYTLRAGWSRSVDQITRLMRPGGEDPRATFSKYSNLERQDIANLTLSAPVDLTPWWEAYATVTGIYKTNRGSFPDESIAGGGLALGGTIEEANATVNASAHNTFQLPGDWRLQVSGYFRGRNLSRGARYLGTRGSFGFGLQRKLWEERLDLRIGFDDPLLLAGYRYEDAFGGLALEGGSYWDSRRGSLSLRYDFGRSGVRATKRRSQLRDTSKRVN